MDEECLCPKCGRNNIVGYKGLFECFDCGYVWHISRWRNKKTVMLLCLLITIMAIGLVLAIPQTWYLLASGKITLKAGAPPPTPTITLVPIDIGEITIGPGEDWNSPVYSTTLTIEGTPADRVYIKAMILGFDIPPEKLQQNIYDFGVTYIKEELLWYHATFISQGSIKWEYWEQLPPEDGWYYFNVTWPPFPSEWLSRGRYNRGISLEITSWYPNEDVTFNIRIYLVIESGGS